MAYDPVERDLKLQLDALLDPAGIGAASALIDESKRLAAMTTMASPALSTSVIQQMQLDALAFDKQRLQIAAWLGQPGFSGALQRATELQDAYRQIELQDAQRTAFFGDFSQFGAAKPTIDFLTHHEASPAIAAAQSAAMESLFRMPELDETQRLLQAAKLDHITQALLGFDTAAAAKVQASLATLTSPWLAISGAADSVAGMTGIQALGNAVRLQAFDLVQVEALRAGLGDWRDPIPKIDPTWLDPVVRLDVYTTRGFDPRLTDFTPAAFHQGLRLAGLETADDAEAEDAVDHDEVLTDAPYVRAQTAHKRLQRLEVEVRGHLMTVMTASFGDTWMRRQTPQGMYDGWVAKKTKDHGETGADLPLLAYIDFSDYVQIIVRKDNWETVFKPIFQRQENVRESFQRLYPLRHATMHARPITQEDEMLLTVETRRILIAFRRHLGAA